MKNLKYPQVSIIVPTVYPGKKALKCLRSIIQLNYPQNRIKTILVDNNSPNNFSKIAKALFPNITVIKNKTNMGFAKAINQGIKKFSSDYFFATNDDIYFEKNSLKVLIHYTQNNPDVGIAGGKQLKYDTKKFLAGGRNFNFFTGLQTNIKGAKKPIFCDQIDGCTMLISKKVIDKIGLFDEGYSPVYSEDLDFCFRAKRAGFKIVYLPQTIFYHHHAFTTSKLPLSEVYFLGFKNRLRFFIKNANPLQLLSFILFHYLMVMPFRIIIRKEPIFLPEIKSIIYNIQNLKKTLHSAN